MCFRTETEDDDPQKMLQDEPQVVGRLFDGKTATALLSDGSRLSADIYKNGDDGMIEAHWLAGAAQGVKELEIANKYCMDGKIIAHEEPTPNPKATPKKRLAATAKTPPTKKHNEEEDNTRGLRLIWG